MKPHNLIPREDHLPRGTVVGRVANAYVMKGETEPYAVAYADGVEGSIIFALSVLVDENLPNVNDSVLLEDVRMKHGQGWYATRARIVRPERSNGA
jgi:hypothetical protein